MKKIRRKSLYQAIDLLQSKKQTKIGTKRVLQDEEIYDKFSMQCTNRKQIYSSFSGNLILSAMKTHIARKEWSQARKLFILLLRRCTDIEPLIWRYALIIVLYSDKNSLSNIYRFLETCIGCKETENNTILRKLLFLSHKKEMLD